MSRSASCCVSCCTPCRCSDTALVDDTSTHGDEGSCSAFSSSVMVAVDAEAVVVEVEVVTSADEDTVEDKVEDGW